MNTAKIKPPTDSQALTVIDSVPLPVEKVKISQAGLRRAAAMLGMKEMGVPKLRAANLVGKWLNQTGVIETAAGQLLATTHGIDLLLQRAIELGVKAGGIEDFCNIVNAVAHLAGIKSRNVESMVNIVRDGLLEKPKRETRNTAFQAGTAITAQDVTIVTR